MATLLECIAAFEVRQHRSLDAVAEIVGPFPTRASLTPRGEVVAMITRLADLVSALDDDDREYVALMLAELAQEA